MKLVKQDVFFFVVLFVIYFGMAILSISKDVMNMVPNILIVIVMSLLSLVVLFEFYNIRYYTSIKESVRNKNRYFKFIFYDRFVMLVSKDGASWVFTPGMGNLEQLKKVSSIEVTLFSNIRGKQNGYKIDPWKYVDEPICPFCENSEEMILRPARAMGYTIGPDEDKNILDEKLVPCICKQSE